MDGSLLVFGSHHFQLPLALGYVCRRQGLTEVEGGTEVGGVRVRGKETMTWHIVDDMYDYMAWDMRVLTILTAKINRRVVLIPFVNFEGKYDLKKTSRANLILSENFRGKYDLLPFKFSLHSLSKF